MREAQQERSYISRVCEFQRINPPSYTRSSTIEDLENFVEELRKVFDVKHVVNAERV